MPTSAVDAALVHSGGDNHSAYGCADQNWRRWLAEEGAHVVTGEMRLAADNSGSANGEALGKAWDSVSASFERFCLNWEEFSKFIS
jgi:hypothetical protein